MSARGSARSTGGDIAGATSLPSYQIFRALHSRRATMFLMSDAYDELLDAAIQQLQDLKAQGVRFVPVSQEGLGALNATPRVAAKPAPVAAEVTRRTVP